PWLFDYLRHCSEDRVREIARLMVALTAESLDEHRRLAQGTPAAARIKPMPYVFAFPSRAAFEADPLGWSIRREHGVDWETVQGDAVRDAEPHISERYGFLVRVADQHGSIDHPGDYVKDLAQAFADAGGRIVTQPVTGFLRADGRITGVVTEKG
ncbi:MAG: FAD-dependent oxidoreductase, partial [Rhodospirillaceae bacterium]